MALHNTPCFPLRVFLCALGPLVTADRREEILADVAWLQNPEQSTLLTFISITALLLPSSYNTPSAIDVVPLADAKLHVPLPIKGSIPSMQNP